MNRSVANRVLEVLSNGEELSTKQISSRFGVCNPRNPIYMLRQEGFAVNTVLRRNSSGKYVRRYVLNSTVPATVTYTIHAAA